MKTTYYFENHLNFCVHGGGWGDAQTCDVAAVLNDATYAFYSCLDQTMIPTKFVHVKQLIDETSPVIFFYETHDEIYLNVTDRYWSKLSYQFAHELCHHVIGNYRNAAIDRFGWFEESLCELASIFVLYQMADSWAIIPPYSNWADYSEKFKSYAQGIVLKDCVLPDEVYFWNWMEGKLPDLYKNRYLRDENREVAIRLLPLFQRDRELWKAVQYLSRIQVTATMSFEEYLNQWQICLPENLGNKINAVRARLLAVSNPL